MTEDERWRIAADMLNMLTGLASDVVSAEKDERDDDARWLHRNIVSVERRWQQRRRANGETG